MILLWQTVYILLTRQKIYFSYIKDWCCIYVWLVFMEMLIFGKFLVEVLFEGPAPFSPLKFRKHGAWHVLHLSWENLNFSRMVAGMRKLFWVTSKGIFRLRPTQIWRLSSQQFWNWEPLKHARNYTLHPVHYMKGGMENTCDGPLVFHRIPYSFLPYISLSIVRFARSP